MLERRLAAVRRGQEGLKTHIGELNMAIAGAGASLRALKAAAGEAAGTLDEDSHQHVRGDECDRDDQLYLQGSNP